MKIYIDVPPNMQRFKIEFFLNSVRYRPIAKQRLGKDIPAEANERNNRTSIARQRISKYASLTIEAVSVWFMRSSYNEGFS
jgi:hypothetical protein